jgi:hypothetical protein
LEIEHNYHKNTIKKAIGAIAALNDMRTNHIKFTLSILAALLVSTIVSAQLPPKRDLSHNSLDYLEKNFPKLTDLYMADLRNCHTHYIFAVDVSGSMIKYDTIVTPVLQAFAMALPDEEQVSVIPFGTTARENTPGLCCRINGQAQKRVLIGALNDLYTNENYTKEFRSNTDISKAVAAINNAILNNREALMNVVVIITDFLNDLPNVGEQKLTNQIVSELTKKYNNVTLNRYVRVEAVQLPMAGTGKGYCLDQLRDKVFSAQDSTKQFETVPVIKDKISIRHWFDQLSRKIMTDKLKAVIDRYNERHKPTLSTNIDIDGNTKASIHWTPNKLYRELKIDSTYTKAGSAYHFSNNKDVWHSYADSALTEIKLGKLKNNHGLFSYCDDDIILGLSLPTPYDDELKLLSIEKPIQNTTDHHSAWLWTFFIPFWWTVAIIVLLIIYAMLVIKAIARNGKERFIGKVEFTKNGRPFGEEIIVKAKPSSLVLIGKGGNNGCNLPDAEWTIRLAKKKSNPFAFWKKPTFVWSASNGFISDNTAKRHRRGKISRYSNASSRVSLDCGPNIDKITHTATIRIKKL